MSRDYAGWKGPGISFFRAVLLRQDGCEKCSIFFEPEVVGSSSSRDPTVLIAAPVLVAVGSRVFAALRARDDGLTQPTRAQYFLEPK